MEQAEHLERSLSGVRVLGSAAQANAHSLTLCDRHDEARLLFTAIGEGCQDNGDHFSVPLVLAQAAYLERRAGRWDRALELMKVGDRSAAGQGQPYRWQPASQAGLGGLRGDRERSVATLERLGPLLHSAGEANVEAIVLRLLGQIRLAHREDEQAWTTLAQSHQIAESHGLFDPADVGTIDLAESGLSTGRLDEVESLLRPARERATAMGRRENVLTGFRQIEVGLLAARGDLEAAVAGSRRCWKPTTAAPCRQFCAHGAPDGGQGLPPATWPRGSLSGPGPRPGSQVEHARGGEHAQNLCGSILG